MPPPADRERRVFASAVHEMRLERRLTQEQVADKGDLGPKYPGQLERDELVPRLSTMIAVARGLGMLPAEFFRAIADAFEAAEADS